jgi:hypothetical protein
VGNLVPGRAGAGQREQCAEFFFRDPSGQDLFACFAQVDETV